MKRVKNFRLLVPIPDGWQSYLCRLPNFKEVFNDRAQAYAVYECTQHGWLVKLVTIIYGHVSAEGYMYPSSLKPDVKIEYLGPYAREYN